MLTIGAVAKRAEVLRYYERRGQLSTARRSASVYRFFPSDEPRRVRFIRRAQALGFTLSEIGALLELRLKDGRRCEKVKFAAQCTHERVRARLTDLRRMERALNALILSCDAGRVTDGCPMLLSLVTGDDR